MKQQYYALLLIALMSMVSSNAFAHDFEVANADGMTIYYVKTSDTEVAVSFQGSSYDDYSNEYTGDVVIPATVSYSGKTYNVTSIGNSAFRECKGITSFNIPRRVTAFGDAAFFNCFGITSIDIPNSVTSIGSEAFRGCIHLTSVAIPNGVSVIEDKTFYDCYDLSSITIPNSVTSIGRGAFYECRRSLTLIDIPNSVTSIGELAFYDCSVLTSVTIPNSVTFLGMCAFQFCSSLGSVTIGNGVTSIGNQAFDGCSSLIKVYMDIETPLSIGSNPFPNRTKTTLYVPEGSKDAYIAADYWKEFKQINEKTVDPSPKIVFTDANIKSLCYNNWDTNGDGELSEAEAAAVTDIGTVFKNNTTITSFNELQYFKGLKSIGQSAFYGCSGLTSITIPSSVKSIGSYAFYNCSGLTKVSVDIETPLVISYNTFSNQANAMLFVPKGCVVAYQAANYWKKFKMILEYDPSPKIVFADANVKSECVSKWDINGDEELSEAEAAAVTKLGTVFQYNTTITSFDELQFFTGLTSIGSNAFLNCSSLASITIPNGVSSIGDYAFGYCSCLTEITIPNNVKTIGINAFLNCSGLTSVTVYGNVSEYGKAVFGGCTNLTSVTFHCSEIGPILTDTDSSVKEIVIGDEVTTIGDYAFSGCSGLTSVTVPNNVMSIESYAFYNTRLKSVTIGSGVLSIGDNAFGSGAKPVKVFWLPNTPPTGCKEAEGTVNYVANESYTELSNTTVYNLLSSMFEVDAVKYVPISFSERTCDAIDCIYNESVEHLSIGKNVSYKGVTLTVKSLKWFACYQNTFLKEVDLVFDGPLGDYAFQGCPQLASVTMEEGITSIGNHTFDACNVIPEMIIPNTVLTIGNYAFAGCSILPNIVIPQSVTSIGDFAFSGCTSITSLSMADRNDDDVELTLGSNGYSPLFADCPLEEVYIGRNISYPTEESKGYSPFYRNLSLKTVTITDKETEISENEFYGCSNLKNVTIGDGVTIIGDGAFFGCSGLASATISNSVTSIGGSAFYECSSLTSITIPNSVTTIGQSAFSGCIGLTSINIPNSVTSIGQSAFYECSGLTSITIPNSVTSIESNVFYGCSGLTSVTIPNGVTTIGFSAFQGCSGLTAITIPNSVTSIGSSAFSNTWLKSLIIGTGVRSIGDNVLASGAKPVKVYWLPNTPPAGYMGAEGTVNYVANKSYTELSNTTVYNLLSSMFEVDAVKYVPISFSERTCDAIDCIYNESVEHLSIGKNVSYKGVTLTVKSLKWFACYQNTFLKEVELSFDGPLGDYAFQGCPQLASVTMEEGITSIGNHTFDACNVIPEMIIPNTVLTIGNYAFAGCSILPNIVIPQSVTSIGDFAFSGCTSITSLSMADRKDDDVELTLGSNGYSPLFADCPLEEVYIGRNISYPTEESRGYSPFYRNLSLKTVTITDKETEISENEFYGCSNLKNVTIGDGVTTICDYAFSGCSSIDNFSFGTKVKTIGKEAFSDCTAMTSLVSRASVPPVCDSQALDDIRKFDCTLSIPTGTLAAYQAADQWKEFLFFNEIDVVVVTPGDANGDGKVNITDAVAVVDYILGNAPEGFNKDAADVNNDGNVNITDAVAIVDIILNAGK